MAVTDDGHVRNTVHAALPQVLAVSIKNVLLLGYGMTLGFPTIVIPALEGDDQTEPLVLTSEQISWIDHGNMFITTIRSWIVQTVGVGCQPNLFSMNR